MEDISNHILELCQELIHIDNYQNHRYLYYEWRIATIIEYG